MKDILQLFRHDAEFVADKHGHDYELFGKKKVLEGDRESAAMMLSSNAIAPPAQLIGVYGLGGVSAPRAPQRIKPPRVEHPIWGRR
jgi:hypothetical protein